MYSGLTGLLLYQKDGDDNGDRFGRSVAGAGDLNNDGSVSNARKVWRRIAGVKRQARVKAYEEARKEALDREAIINSLKEQI